MTSSNSAPSVEPVNPANFRTLSVLMPVYNEALTLRLVVDRVLRAPIPIAVELVIVDDGSTDGSREILRELADAEPRIQAIFHARNQGKAAAIRTAIAHVAQPSAYTTKPADHNLA